MPRTTHVSTNTLPPWQEDEWRELIRRSRAFSETPYSTYHGQRLSQPNQDVFNAHYLGRQVGSHLPYFENAREQYSRASGEFPSDYARYVDPYNRQVLDAIRNEGLNILNEDIMPKITSHFSGGNNLRSTNYLNTVAKARDRSLQTILNSQGRVLGDAFRTSADIYNRDRDRNRQVAEGSQRLGTAAQVSRIADMASLGGQGEQQQQEQQRGLDLMYNDYLRQQQYPQEQFNVHSGILHGVPEQSRQVSYTQTPAAPQVNQWGNLGALAGQLYGASMLAQRKKGGPIRAKRKSYNRNSNVVHGLGWRQC